MASATFSGYIFLNIRYKESEKKIAKAIKEYNKRLKKDDPKNYKKKRLWNQHGTTMKAILRQYKEHLDKLIQLRLPESDFRINNAGIATMQDDLSRYSVLRHVKRLIEAGFLANKVFRGHRASYSIEINPELLVAEHHFEYTRMLVDKYKKEHKKRQLSELEIQKLESIRPTFSWGSRGHIVATCDHTETGALQEQNNNMVSGIVNLSFAKSFGEIPNESLSLQEQKTGTREHPSPEIPPAQGSPRPLSSKKVQEQVAPGRARTDRSALEAAKLLEYLLLFTWDVAYKALWKNKNLSPEIVSQAKRFILLFLTKDNPKLAYGQRAELMIERIQLTQRYLERSPDRWIPLPDRWFNPENPDGFVGTKKWYDETVKRRKRDKEYNLNIKLTAQQFRAYSENPTAETYRKAAQRLGKLKDKKPLDLFNSCVLDPSKFTHQTFENFRAEYQVTPVN